MPLKNYMEDAVFQVLDNVIATRPDVCPCERCRLDIAALALNQLPTKYVVTEKGEIYARIQKLHHQFEADVIPAILIAIDKVAQNPRCRQNE